MAMDDRKRGKSTRKRADRTNMSLLPGSSNPKIGYTLEDAGPTQTYNPYTNTGQAKLQQMNTAPGVNSLAGGETPTGSSGSASGGNTQQTNFGNEYYWGTPEFAVGQAMNNSGMSTDVNSSFYNAMTELAPGLKWMSLLGGGPTGGMANWQGNVQDWMGGGAGGFGQMGQLNGLVQSLVGGGTGNAALEGYIDSLDPRQMVQAITSMMQTAGYGQIAPELVQGMSGQLANVYNQFGIQGGNLLANLAPGQSDMDVFRNFLSTQGDDILSYFGM